jgi:magnesium-transporting ATPase (P-type)
MISRTTLCPVPRAWILSPRARRFYLFCAIADSVLFAIFVVEQAALALGSNTVVESFLTILFSGHSILLWLGTLGGVLLTLAMWCFWFAFDRSTFTSRLIWFLPLFFLFLTGPVVYHFVVYRPQSALMTRDGQPNRSERKSDGKLPVPTLTLSPATISP